MHRPKHILIAEDEEVIRMALSIILKQAGYSVTTVSDGTEAFATIKKHRQGKAPVDLLITDILMSGMTGMVLKSELKKANLDLPTFAVTGYGDKEIMVELIREGFEGCLEKPIQGDQILKHLERFFEKEASEPDP